VEWAARNAGLLREGRLTDADIPNIAEEVEDLGNSWRHALDSHMTQLLAHLLKLQQQPEYPGLRDWKGTVTNQRIQIRRLLKKAPSLKNQLNENLEENYRDAVRLASDETGLPRLSFPGNCPWPVEQVLDEDWLPSGNQ
jgi:hypothetical protein